MRKAPFLFPADGVVCGGKDQRISMGQSTLMGMIADPAGSAIDPLRLKSGKEPCAHAKGILAAMYRKISVISNFKFKNLRWEITNMKTAYLINKQQPDGAMRFAIADSGEWLSAVAENEQLPSEQRRYFIRDSRGKLFCNDPPAQMVLLPSHNRK